MRLRRAIAKGTKILVTGGTGFIGARLVEALVRECGAEVRLLVRNFKSASRVARLNVSFCLGDLGDCDSLHRAIQGCDIVFNLAYDFTAKSQDKRSVTAAAAENVAQAAHSNRVKRLVHFGTISSYGDTKDGLLDESMPMAPTEDVYGLSKHDADQVFLRWFNEKGLPVTIVEPTIVYGPFSKPWTHGPLGQLSSGIVVLNEGGLGLCNAVYIDDVVQAALLSATNPAAIGNKFLISGEEPVTWRDFYGAYEGMLGYNATLSLDDEKIDELCRDPRLAFALVSDNTERREIRLVDTQADVQEKTVPLHLPSPSRKVLLKSRTRVDISKAKSVLGYSPRWSFAAGMELTRKYAAWANLLPAQSANTAGSKNYLSSVQAGQDLRAQQARLSRERLGALRNRHSEQRCFIIGNGPSLRHTDLQLLKDEVTIGCNGLFLLYDRMGFQPTYYTVEDSLVAEDRADIINRMEGTTKIFPADLRYCLIQDKNTIYVNFIRPGYKGFPQFSDNFEERAYWGGTVTFLNLQLAYFLGCREIYLVGVDHSYVDKHATDVQKDLTILARTPDPNHFHPDYFGPGFRYHVPNVERMEVGYKKAREFLSAQGVSVYNATLGGRLELFPRIPLEDVFQKPRAPASLVGAVPRMPASQAGATRAPLISVIIPAYNVERYIDKCLRSVVMQTMDPGLFEVIVVNDGSTDQTSDRVGEVLRSYDHVRLITNKENTGLSEARNRGLEHARGKYILFLDGDDYLDPTALEKLHRLAVEKNSDVVIAGFKRVNERGEVLSVRDLKHSLTKDQILRSMFDGTFSNVAWGSLLDKSLFIDHSIRFPAGAHHEDIYTTYKLYVHSRCIEICDEPLFFWLFRESSISNSINLEILNDYILGFVSRREFLQRQSLFEEYRKEFYQGAARAISHLHTRALKLDDPDRKRECFVAIFNTATYYFDDEFRPYLPARAAQFFTAMSENASRYLSEQCKPSGSDGVRVGLPVSVHAGAAPESSRAAKVAGRSVEASSRPALVGPTGDRIASAPINARPKSAREAAGESTSRLSTPPSRDVNYLPPSGDSNEASNPVAVRPPKIEKRSRTLVILGNGPSLKGFNFARLRNFDAIGMNAAYRYWDRIAWYPRYYLCLDLVVGLYHKDQIARLIHDRALNGMDCFMLRRNLIEALPPQMAALPCVLDFDALNGTSDLFPPVSTSTGSRAALFGALLGYDRMILMGIDCNYPQEIEGTVSRGGTVLELVKTPARNPNYFFKEYLLVGDRFSVPERPHSHLESWRGIVPTLAVCGSKVWNGSRNSRLDIFPKRSFSEIECEEAAFRAGRLVIQMNKAPCGTNWEAPETNLDGSHFCRFGSGPTTTLELDIARDQEKIAVVAYRATGNQLATLRIQVDGVPAEHKVWDDVNPKCIVVAIPARTDRPDAATELAFLLPRPDAEDRPGNGSDGAQSGFSVSSITVMPSTPRLPDTFPAWRYPARSLTKSTKSSRLPANFPLSHFDGRGYLQSNPDVREALVSGKVASALVHYYKRGFGEGRRYAMASSGLPNDGTIADVFDGFAYLEAYPEVGAAIRAGRYSSALDHFLKQGRREGHQPFMRYDREASPATALELMRQDAVHEARVQSITVGRQAKGAIETEILAVRQDLRVGLNGLAPASEITRLEKLASEQLSKANGESAKLARDGEARIKTLMARLDALSADVAQAKADFSGAAKTNDFGQLRQQTEAEVHRVRAELNEIVATQLAQERSVMEQMESVRAAALARDYEALAQVDRLGSAVSSMRDEMGRAANTAELQRLQEQFQKEIERIRGELAGIAESRGALEQAVLAQLEAMRSEITRAREGLAVSARASDVDRLDRDMVRELERVRNEMATRLTMREAREQAFMEQIDLLRIALEEAQRRISSAARSEDVDRLKHEAQRDIERIKSDISASSTAWNVREQAFHAHVATLKSEVETAKVRAELAETKVAHLNEDAREIAGSVSDLHSKLTAENAQVERLQAELDAIKQQTAATSARVSHTNLDAFNVLGYQGHSRALTKGNAERLAKHWGQLLGLSISERELYYLAHRASTLESACVGRLAASVNDILLRILVARAIRTPRPEIMEIGTLFGVGVGVMHEALFQLYEGVRFTVIDPLDGYYGAGNKDSLTGIPVSRRAFEENIKRIGIPKRNVSLVQLLSTEPRAIKLASRKRYDLAIIDADHSYSGVKADSENYLSMVKPGGFVVFDDYNNRAWPGVKQYVDEEILPRTSLKFLGAEWHTAVFQVGSGGIWMDSVPKPS